MSTVGAAEFFAARKKKQVVDASLLLWTAASNRSAVMRQVHRRIQADAGWADPFTDWKQDLATAAGTDAVSQLRRETRLQHRFVGYRATAEPAQWHTSVVSGLWAALDEARQAGVGHAGRPHLIAGLLRDPAGALRGLGDDRDELIAMVRAIPSWREPAPPYTPFVSRLDAARETSDRTGLRGRWDRKQRRDWIGGNRYRSAVLPNLLWEAARQAVRLDDGPVTAAHLLVGVVVMHAQLRVADRQLRPVLRPFNGAPAVLEAHGVTLPRAVAGLPSVRPADPVVVPEGRAQLVIGFTGTAWTAEAVDTVDRAVALARDAGHPATESSHLALAALDDGHGTAARLLAALDADPAAIRADIAHHLAQAPAAEEAAPSPGRRADRSPARARRLSP
ncbi:Clp protease N-terminal domain-containing protein [Dactylosporangium sp. NPDC049525]|uniref:Clp protease N-terminal domain-containing protein n=1 Tax=Dactylosporangium sp. NPDC049525 TaxID=3154730 RepID=UPI003419AC1A